MDSHETIDGSTAAERPWFYWEYPADQRPEIRAAALADEGHLAIDINHGRRLVTLPVDDQECPNLAPLPSGYAGETIMHPEDELLVYSDTISSILQAAAYIGLDPWEVCERAIFTQQAVFDDSAGAARNRGE